MKQIVPIAIKLEEEIQKLVNANNEEVRVYIVIVIVVAIVIDRRERIKIARRANSAVKTSKERMSRAEKVVRFASEQINMSLFSTV